jgi:hypothetical protein
VVCLYNRKNLCWDILQAWDEVNEGDLRLKAKSWTAKSWGAGEEVAGGWLEGLFSRSIRCANTLVTRGPVKHFTSSF